MNEAEKDLRAKIEEEKKRPGTITAEYLRNLLSNLNSLFAEKQIKTSISIKYKTITGTSEYAVTPTLCFQLANPTSSLKEYLLPADEKILEAIKLINYRSEQEKLYQLMPQGIGEIQIIQPPYSSSLPIEDDVIYQGPKFKIKRQYNPNGISNFIIFDVEYDTIDESNPFSPHKGNEILIQNFTNPKDRIEIIKDNEEITGFRLNGDIYHIKNVEYMDGNCTVIWKDTDMPTVHNAIRLMTAKINGKVRGIDAESLTDFINRNPLRFVKYYETHRDVGDSEEHIPELVSEFELWILQQLPESVLEKLQLTQGLRNARENQKILYVLESLGHGFEADIHHTGEKED